MKNIIPFLLLLTIQLYPQTDTFVTKIEYEYFLKKLQSKLEAENYVDVGSSVDEVKKILGNPISIESGFFDTKLIIDNDTRMACQMNNSTWSYNLQSFQINYEHTIFARNINEENKVVNDVVTVTPILGVMFDKGTQSVAATKIYFLHSQKIKWGGKVTIILIE